ncbi:MAG: FtsX-like permease family protein [Gemmatimonadales bacterium]|nr:FtsX-like permease family protein [Gemmatimonadales bacterium]NIN11296.1 FtsX-like permease family protein [Gemmatimonadales bacterium]NIN49895.1 FtsX-like permease family protein [Gemmatimonadales bacterium]NIP07359.1 FtsX-like permease family protein [Gemmatimonadales bacterium]NIR03054.1 FtsX-like permease family protein [Gemmatimonadales bacterium]
MPFREAIRLALQVIWNQKMKSGFSVIGVFIGVTFLIAVVSIVEGMNNYMTDRFAGAILGVNTFQLRRYPRLQIEDVSRETRRKWWRRPRISYEDARAVTAGITVPHRAAWESLTSEHVEYGGKVARDIEIVGTSEQYFAIKDWDIAEGRPFSQQEARTGQPVIVLGNELANRLFENADPLGRHVKIRKIPYRVVGVVESQGNIFGISLDKFAVAPALSPIKRIVAPPRVIDALVVQTNSVEDLQTAMTQTEAVMRSRRGLRPTEENNFSVETSEAILDFWGKINRILMLALPGLVSISLVVGGIVIMNIMLMAVAERTREIGIRKSLGARRRDIMRQFLVESATLAIVGAGIGIGTGLALAALVQATTFLPARVAPWSVAVGVLLGAGVGIAAGLYPASRAARLDPVEAIRHE